MRDHCLRCLFSAIVLLTIFGLRAHAQTDNVGIGTTTPEPSAILDVANPYNTVNGTLTKGMLVPRVGTIELQQMEAAYDDTLAEGLLVYELEAAAFKYYRKFNPPPVVPPYGEWVELLSQAQSSDGTPSGAIIMWHGTISSIPNGWALCDGSNGTPDLTNKFVVSVENGGVNPGTAAIPNQFVSVNSTLSGNDRPIYKLAYIMKL